MLFKFEVFGKRQSCLQAVPRCFYPKLDLRFYPKFLEFYFDRQKNFCLRSSAMSNEWQSVMHAFTAVCFATTTTVELTQTQTYIILNFVGDFVGINFLWKLSESLIHVINFSKSFETLMLFGVWHVFFYRNEYAIMNSRKRGPVDPTNVARKLLRTRVL